ncbi:similar to Saccharomyces cerevisiae YGR141W VPS62 Vacuolar protein sorting (VPS) protein required for cytoplasm to vacuole targeting of proteins [Maudiozyma saulgeensis]|uniref:Similar to Saccharomyces cerevisiae YGR141W VPS62 Vacuolar protein sorting (VPS) protein required for cytoplasm to vacuole targeting of proteins n=1 Tax=Maudiozyma saulgeensis TaxID=1789683 RepID=A0A1X7QXC4_9SACH|nr:similar to Saccharomyces cerevisiae YGR141W VPS62 Vacuolar protein sorting (VPS) protein required for cytoplasm to vacuole targeting of proteins [Kazachstania saulgeensis]
MILYIWLILPSLIYCLPPDPFLDSNFLKDPNVSRQLNKLPPLLSPDQLTDETRSLSKHLEKVPQYIIDNCPMVHLYSEEKYWPSDITDFIKNFHLADKDGNVFEFENGRTNLTSLQDLQPLYEIGKNNDGSQITDSADLYMTTNEDFSKNPDWLIGHRPEYGTGLVRKSPAVLLISDKGNGWVDAFWFYFYPFNWGPYIMGYGPWGNHIGDWEHSLVRFHMGEPKFLWMSAHSGGTAYQFDAIEKVKKLRRVDGKIQNEIINRPLIFSARGTHANYASVGQYSHDVPFFFMPLSDFTDRGPMWDPVMNFYAYQIVGDGVRPMSEREEKIGTSWLSFAGRWGDKQLPSNDPRQKWCPVQWRYIDGPLGPLFKNLERTSLCESFKLWNMWHGCPPRRWIKKAVGLDAERNDLVGDNCGVLLYKIRPKWLRGLLRLLMWRGTICFCMDYFTG